MAYFTYKRQVKLLPGQTLGFTKGKGYYAKADGAPAPYPGGGAGEPKSGGGGNPYAVPTRPAPRPPARPSVPPKPPINPYGPTPATTIDQQAATQAQQGVDAQSAEVRRQQALAAAQARADEQAQAGFSEAAAKMMADLGPQGLEGFLAASKQEGDLGQGLATGVQQDVENRVAADQAFAESQGQTGGSNVDTKGLHDVVYGLNGEIPGNSFAEQGAAMNAWGLAQAPIALNAGREEIAARMAQARSDNDQYAQKLLDIAAQYPQLKAQALQQLNQYELDKANYREQVRTDTANIASQKRQDALSARSERAQEKAAGINAANDASALQYKWASLQFQSQKAVNAAKAAVAKGARPNASLSKAYGYIVDANGNAILDATGNKIPVAKTGTAKTQTAVVNRTKALSKANVTAFNYATKLLGNYVPAGKNSLGKYLAAPKFKNIPQGKPGAVFPDGTTNNPKRAARDGDSMSYQDAVAKVWGEIDGDGLMARYGLSREQVMQRVNAAMRRAGWKRK